MDAEQILSVLKTNKVRILVICFLIYLIALVRVASHGGWSLESGFQWSTPGYQLFPIPINWYDFGYVITQIVVPMGIADIIIYVIFVGPYFWIVWMALAISYIIHPPTVIKLKNRILGVLNRSP